MLSGFYYFLFLIGAFFFSFFSFVGAEGMVTQQLERALKIAK